MMLWKNRNKRVGLYVMVVTSCLVMATIWAVLATPETALAHKDPEDPDHKHGKTGDVGGDVSGWIFSQVTFDGTGSVTSDDERPYVDGVDRAEMRIGRNFNIFMDFNTHKKKDSIRTLHFPVGFPTPVPPDNPVCWPTLRSGDVTTPIGPSPIIALPAQDAKLVINGQDHDDSPVDPEPRLENAVLTVKDDNGETWFVYFGRGASEGGDSFFSPCGDWMEVTRLSNLEGKSRWTFSTAGLGYVYRDNNPPHNPTEFWGVVTMPFSGTIESLTDEPEPGT